MRRLVDLLISDRWVLAVITLNTVALGLVESFPSGSRAAAVWHWVDYGCIVFFLVEACLKNARWGWRRYWSSRWNRFDLTLVVVSLPALLMPFVGGLGVFGQITMLRIGRLFRLFRVLRFIPNVEHLALGIRRSLRASIGVFLALLLVNFILAMGATILFGDLDEEAFGTPLKASYTLFKVFTVEGWYEVPDEVANRVGAGVENDEPGPDAFKVKVGLRLFFVVSVLVGGILGLSLANAVFVDQMMMDNTDVLEAKVDAIAEELRALRRDLGRDGSGPRP